MEVEEEIKNRVMNGGVVVVQSRVLCFENEEWILKRMGNKKLEAYCNCGNDFDSALARLVKG